MSTVVIGCKLPNGLRLEVGQGDQRKVVVLKGQNSARVAGGYGITTNVDADLWMAWLKEHPHHPAVKRGFVFVNSSVPNAAAQAREQSALRTGLEPLTRKDLPKADPENKFSAAQPDPNNDKQILKGAPQLHTETLDEELDGDAQEMAEDDAAAAATPASRGRTRRKS